MAVESESVPLEVLVNLSKSPAALGTASDRLETTTIGTDALGSWRDSERTILHVVVIALAVDGWI